MDVAVTNPEKVGQSLSFKLSLCTNYDTFSIIPSPLICYLSGKQLYNYNVMWLKLILST